MPTQRNSTLLGQKARGKDKREEEKCTILANILIRSAKDATLKAVTKLRKLIPFRPLTKYYQLAAIHLIQGKLERPISLICLMTRDKKPKFKWKLF